MSWKKGVKVSYQLGEGLKREGVRSVEDEL